MNGPFKRLALDRRLREPFVAVKQLVGQTVRSVPVTFEGPVGAIRRRGKCVYIISHGVRRRQTELVSLLRGLAADVFSSRSGAFL